MFQRSLHAQLMAESNTPRSLLYREPGADAPAISGAKRDFDEIVIHLSSIIAPPEAAYLAEHS